MNFSSTNFSSCLLTCSIKDQYSEHAGLHCAEPSWSPLRLCMLPSFNPHTSGIRKNSGHLFISTAVMIFGPFFLSSQHYFFVRLKNMAYVDVPSEKDVKSGIQESVAAPLLHGECSHTFILYLMICLIWAELFSKYFWFSLEERDLMTILI